MRLILEDEERRAALERFDRGAASRHRALAGLPADLVATAWALVPEERAGAQKLRELSWRDKGSMEAWIAYCSR